MQVHEFDGLTELSATEQTDITAGGAFSDFVAWAVGEIVGSVVDVGTTILRGAGIAARAGGLVYLGQMADF